MLRLATFLACLLAASVALADSPVGSVSRVLGRADRQGEGQTVLLTPGSSVFEDDRLTTFTGTRLEIRFVDGTRLTVGERSQVTIDSYIFRDRSHVNALLLRISGAFRYVSGKLGKQKGAEVNVRTPLANVGVRGTDFIGVPIDGQYGVLLVNGAVVVTTRAGSATLDRPGTGVNIAGNGGLSPVTQWPADKVRRAIRQVSFP
jgi:hypothetical protein